MLRVRNRAAFAIALVGGGATKEEPQGRAKLGSVAIVVFTAPHIWRVAPGVLHRSVETK